MSESELAELRRELQTMDRLTTRLETLATTEGDRCPYRETIARAANNVKRLDDMDRRVDAMGEHVTGLRIEVVRVATIAGFSGGGGLGIVGGIIYAVGKAAGWW